MRAACAALIACVCVPVANMPLRLADPALPEAMQVWRHGEDRVMDTTRVVMHQIVLPADCDHMGICIGGQVCVWLRYLKMVMVRAVLRQAGIIRAYQLQVLLVYARAHKVAVWRSHRTHTAASSKCFRGLTQGRAGYPAMCASAERYTVYSMYCRC